MYTRIIRYIRADITHCSYARKPGDKPKEMCSGPWADFIKLTQLRTPLTTMAATVVEMLLASQHSSKLHETGYRTVSALHLTGSISCKTKLNYVIQKAMIYYYKATRVSSAG